ncbi:RagB/SusD family nutrient uptake outer membrane protein [Riemerella anatipestifer]|uniref:RagB/SusD family nutrient uptake outer membrane protein n=1 Tax=Riemerella anatipestifer TaxID=34085 RepID=UPI0007EC8DA8|nr:RagB/SusD family nutrient uptake outer membrane protein [Riemerella anatipestifer]MCW0498160.1 RagB/SusD family nutrient uptake outer membrane protein [Riemerella anatipestifer]MDD1524622.1 RagB/SusD family nutrient uptake outer membrane protein [Riemerella anatipestifer]OBP57370.1 hypothetical protein AWM61_02660 [Riemerella anatipestifer]PST44684.1 RagB/SusD family nutrient uptake outer membrane protein [Riemerella anatipestifer]
MKSILRNTFVRIGIPVLVVSSFASCSSDRLDLQPFNQVSDETIYTDPALIEQAVMGMYNAAQVGDYAGGRRGYPFGSAYHQQNDVRGEDVVNVAAFYQFTYMSTYNGSSSLNNIYYWLDTYRLINRANLIITGINDAVAKGVMTKAASDGYLGEALFFRAISHFELLKHFSRPYHVNSAEHYAYGVPYMLKGSKDLVTVEENSGVVDRETVQKSYERLLKDLDEAENLLPSKSNVYRASKEAAIAYKTIVKLHQRDWSGVIAEANKLDGKFSLEDTPNGVFVNNSNNKESIFSLQNSDTNSPGVNGALAAMFKTRALIAISPIIWNDPAWLANDKRRFELADNAGKPVKDAMVFTSRGAKFTNKYKDDVNFSDASPIVRYAEVLLNRAEAKARLGDDTYINDLNKVRNRSLVDISVAYKLSDFTSKKAAVEAIIKEKRIEFIGEGKRWGDIHRLINDDLVPTYGIPAKYANTIPKATDYVIGVPYVLKTSDLKAIPYSDARFLWPIPDLEINATPSLRSQQNKDW